jgi:hypothetical protein
MTAEQTVTAAEKLSELVDTLLVTAPTFWETLQRQAAIEGWQNIAWTATWATVAALAAVRASYCMRTVEADVAKQESDATESDESGKMDHVTAVSWYAIALIVVAIGAGLKAIQFGVSGVGKLANPDYYAIIALSGGG